MSIITTPLPYIFSNGTTADATQVNADLNQIVGNVNANAAASGANADITSMSQLATLSHVINNTAQPAFHASRSTNQTTSGNLVCPTVDSQQGGTNYASGTGTFTAPSNGVYLFCVSFQMTNSSGGNLLAYAQIVTNLGLLIAEQAFTTTAGTSTWLSCSGVTSLNAGQTVTVQQSGAANLIVVGGSVSFSGAMLF
jgi:hypothetical protein